jgi:Amidohydrolase family
VARRDIDSVLPHNPVMAIHASNHGAVLNSAAMKIFDITADTPTPEAGLILRERARDNPLAFSWKRRSCPFSRRRHSRPRPNSRSRPCYRDKSFRAARDQLKNPATRAGFSSINSVVEADQYFAITGADGAKLNR